MTLVIDLDNGETVYIEKYLDPVDDRLRDYSPYAKWMIRMSLEWIEGTTKDGHTVYIQVKHIVKIAEVDA